MDPPGLQQRVVDSGAGDTSYGRLFDVWWPDAPHPVLRNTKTFEEWVAAGRPPPGDRPGEGTSIGTIRRPWEEYQWPRYAPGMVTPDFDGGPEYAPMWAGESCSDVNDIKPARVIVRDLVRDAEAALADAHDPGQRVADSIAARTVRGLVRSHDDGAQRCGAVTPSSVRGPLEALGCAPRLLQSTFSATEDLLDALVDAHKGVMGHVSDRSRAVGAYTL